MNERSDTPSRAKMAYITTLISIVFVCSMYYFYGFSTTLLVLFPFVALPTIVERGYHRWIYILYKTLPRDITAGIRFVRLQLLLYFWRAGNETLPKLFLKHAARNPNRICYMHNADIWTYGQLNEFSERVASYLHKRGICRGSVVCLLMDGCPEYVGIWLGAARLGAVTALINTTLRAETLLHSIHAAKPVVLIYGPGHAQAVKEIRDQISESAVLVFDVKCVSNESAKRLEAADVPVQVPNVENMSGGLLKVSAGECPNYETLRVSVSDPLLYIYTSGTTGLPKAAILTHARYCMLPAGIKIMAPLASEDVLYCPLPLYHASGGAVGVGQALLGTCPVVIKTKFSVSSFWTDCNKYGCTASLYIGEICRYLMSAPTSPGEKIHGVKVFIGNGLQRNIWQACQERFNVQKFIEFYGSTEGNANLINIEGKLGAVGFVPRYARALYPVALVACDPETGVAYRNAAGYCISCAPGEPGLLLGKIGKATYSQFQGYTDRGSTNKKIMENVFKKGDRYFNTGDVLEYDEFGYLYFRDRTGDTFRWRGENVSTHEVEVVLSGNGAREVAVYGVAVPGEEGRCGMAAIADPHGTLDLQALAQVAKNSLPVFARPLFIRVAPALPLTSTFKIRKVDLRSEGYDLSKMKPEDRLYFYNKKTEGYVPLTVDMYQAILEQKLRL